MRSLKERTTVTRLYGMKNFLEHGIEINEINEDTTTSELLEIIDNMIKEKNDGYKSKLRNIQDEGKEDDLFR